jgi:zinc transport system substrate-binding protein
MMSWKKIMQMSVTIMRKPILISLLLLTLIWSQGCSVAPPGGPEKQKVAATIFPLCDIAGNIAGARAEVIQILPPGASPHTYELTPRQVKQLQGVLVVFSVGHGLDNWADALVDTLPGVKTMVVDDGVHLKEFPSSKENREEHRHAGENPHYWLSIDNGKSIAKNIGRELIRIDPAGESYYRANLEAYLAKLDKVKQEAEARITSLPDKKMVTFHDAWFYFAEQYGLEIVGTFEPFPGKQPTPRSLAELQDKAREHKVKAVFSEPQLSNEAIASFVKDLGLSLHVLDPLGGIEGRNSYIELMEYNTNVIAEALSNE